MYKEYQKVSAEDIIRAMEEKHSDVYKSGIRKACSFAAEKHKGQTRVSGEPYINHPKRVAYIVAKLGMDSDTVIASLLHDLVEDCNVTIEEIASAFNQNVADLVESVTSVNAEITEAEKKRLTKADIDKMSNTKLIKKLNRRALLIKIADRLDNLNTIGCFPIEKQIRKARDTREILIPIAYRAEAYELIDELEDLCLKIEHNERYNEIAEAYNKILIYNSDSTKLFLSNLVLLVDSLTGKANTPFMNSFMDENARSGLGKAIKRIEYNKRSIVSLYRQTVRTVTNLKKETTSSLLAKDETPSYDITLVVSDDYVGSGDNVDIKDVFFHLYDKYLIYCGVEIKSINYTSHGNSPYILITDEMNNLYRVFVRSEFGYMRYKIGDIVEGMDKFDFKDIDERDPRNTYNKKIKVFRRDGSEMYIDEGSTVLDFAFAIHTSLGLHFDYAVIDGDTSHLGPYTRLNEGDLVYIYPSDKVTASIKWFRYVRTSKAIDKLIRSISDTYNIPS